MKFMLAQSLAQVPVKYVSVQCRGGLITVLYGNCQRIVMYNLCIMMSGSHVCQAEVIH